MVVITFMYFIFELCSEFFFFKVRNIFQMDPSKTFAFNELEVRNQAKPESLQTFKAPSKEIAEMFIEYYVVRIL